MRGFWDGAIVAQFERRLRANLTTLASYDGAIGEPRLLLDLTAFDVQTQDVLAALAAVARDGRLPASRIALVVSSSLLRLQSRRVAPDYAMFDTRDDALAYLGNAPDRANLCFRANTGWDPCRAQG